jgi:hypothetical protein
VINLKNILVGFLVSFIGSIPLGYLNVVGFQLFQKTGMQQTVSYLLGVIAIEFLVIYGTLLFAKQLANNKQLTKFIEAFSIIFMFVLALVFYLGSNSKTNYTLSFTYAPFLLGIALSCLNFIQIPFWTGWNLWLLNGKYIEVSGVRKYCYVFGTLAGTFFGMLSLILSLHYFAAKVDFLAKYLMQYIIPFVFLALGIFQTLKFYKKHNPSLPPRHFE